MLNHVLANSVVRKDVCPEDVSDYVNAHIGHHRLTLLGSGKMRSSLRYASFARLGLSHISYGGKVRVHSPDLEEVYHLQVVTSGRCTWNFDEDRLSLDAGQALMMNPHEKSDLTYSQDCQKLIVKIPESILKAACVDNGRALPRDGLRFQRQVMNLDASLAFMRLVEAVYEEASEAEADMASASGAYADLLANKLLAVFPCNLSRERNGAGADGSLQLIRRYLQERIREDVTVEELADLCNVSVRSLYNVFSREIGITPKLFIKQTKLQSLHADLKQGINARNVTEVALDYGFSHLGRFSSDYRKLFGELPSETLRRTR
ncbi:AraC family transcriptional regulator [Marinobacterium rhizophilum]|uniref:AraC family transcriptional regulator n=1 Tax=Marinobacterium rhizophilum TaxID=420402 RepID=A0ABY5HK84_9GAMM|nr:AraC family transcriptional regulator [Marinobacterium rhizophilum]UTW12792.1 AraC family transcriptional regulator [Marinobacterium rhizophilum]